MNGRESDHIMRSTSMHGFHADLCIVLVLLLDYFHSNHISPDHISFTPYSLRCFGRCTVDLKPL